MWNSNVIAVFLMVTVAGSTVIEDRYEEEVTYRDNPLCAPSKLDKGIKCAAVVNAITVQGGLVSSAFLHLLVERRRKKLIGFH